MSCTNPCLSRCLAAPLVGAAAVLGLVSFAGCYDGEVLLEEARSTALSTRLAELDLGQFRTTLPRDHNAGSFMEINFHIFATVPRSRVSAIKKQVRADEYRLRHETLAALRSAPREELAEPSLAQLRRRIERAVNSVLSDAPIRSIGFYQVMLRHG